MARWVKTFTPGGYSGLTDALFVVDLDTGFGMGFQKVNSTYYVTFNGTYLEGGYATANDALDAVLEFTEAHTFVGLTTYS
jgi:lysozyme family protein